MATAPLPCPICGGLPVTHKAQWEGERSHVQCHPCRLVMGGAPREPLDSIIQRWNNRPPEKAPA